MKTHGGTRVVSSVVAALTLVAVSLLGIATVGAANHGQVVPEAVRRNVPVVLDGDVRAHAQIGNRVFVGGNFQQVRRPNGTTITQPNIFAYDVNTGLLDESFRPAVNNRVFSMDVNPAGDALYVGGRFTTWDNRSTVRVAKLDALGNLDTSFQGSANANVRDVAVTNDDVYLAGDFTSVGGQSRAGFASIDADTGAVDPGFIMNVQNSAATGQLGRGIVVTNDGNTVFGLHFGTRINGSTREALVKINTAGNTASLSNWRVDWSGQTRFNSCLGSLRDIAIAPNDSFVVIGGQGADNPPNCDSVLRYPTGGTGVIGFDWSARMYSSVFSLAVSDTAVYVGGHFCAAPRNGAAPGGETHERTDGTANGCNLGNPNDSINPSQRFPNDAVFRSQLAALNPANGQALSWDPGSNAFTAVYDLTVTDRGLLAGQDRDRYNGVLTGRSGFFDLGGFTPPNDPDPDPPPPPPPAGGASCSVAVNANDVPVVTYSGFTGVTAVNVRRNGSWIANDSGGAGTYNDTSAQAGVAYSYVVRWRPGGVRTDVACTPTSITIGDPDPDPPPPPPAGGASCSVAVNANNMIVVTYSGFANVNAVNVRRNGGWIGSDSPGAGTFNDTSAQAGVAYSYVVRSRPGGVVSDVACSPATITIGANPPPPPPAGGPSCTVAVNANNVPVVTYSGFTGVTVVNVRRNGSWIANDDGGAGTYNDTSAQAGVAYSYLVRWRPGGVRTDVACTPATITIN